MFPIGAPYPQFTDSDGQALDDGQVFFGTANQNPETNPIVVYWDLAGTQPAAQPIRTIGGYAARAGTPANLYVGSDYSITVKRANGAMIAHEPSSFASAFAGPSGSSLIGFLQSGTGAGPRTLQSKDRDSASLTDFASGGVQASTAASAAVNAAALQAALDAHASVYIPDGTFNVGAAILLNSNNRLYGPGTLQFSAALAALVCIQATGKTNIEVSGIEVLGTVGSLPLDLIQLRTCTKSKVTNCRLRYASHEGISLNESTYDCEVAGNLVRDISTAIGWGIGLFWDIQRCNVHNNTVMDCGAYGILVDDGTSGQSDNLPCIANDIHDNIVYTTTTAMWGISIEGSYDNDVHDNYIQTIGTIGIDVVEGNSTTVFVPLRNKIHNNMIRSDSAAATIGIRLNGGSNNSITSNKITAGDIGVSVGTAFATTMFNNLVESNEVYECTAGSNNIGILLGTSVVDGFVIRDNQVNSPGKQGIFVQGGTNVVVNDNQVVTPGREGILVTNAGQRSLKVVGNHINGASASSATTYAAIQITPASGVQNGALIAHNVFDDTQGAPTCTLGLVITGGGGTFSEVYSNDNRALKTTITPTFLSAVAGGVTTDTSRDWTPTVTFGTPGDLNVVYSTRVGSYIQEGKKVTVSFVIQTSTFTHTTASGNLNITGFPVAARTLASQQWKGALAFAGITKAGYTNFVLTLTSAGTTGIIVTSGSAQSIAIVGTGDTPTGGTLILQGTITYEIG